MFGTAAYDRAARELRRPVLEDTTSPLDRGELLRLATLAASSHNTQPWKFEHEPMAMRVQPDFTRRCPIVDPDDGHLWKSLGCAAENLVHAAAAQGHRARVSLDPRRGDVVVAFERSPGLHATELSRAIPHRQCTRQPYETGRLEADELRQLEQVGRGEGVRVALFTAARECEQVLEYLAAANQAQLSDRALRAELTAWIRFNPRAALATGDGLCGHTSGRPALPTALGRRLARFVLTPAAQTAIDASHVRASAGLAVFLAARDALPSWVEVGRAAERFALCATTLGIRTAFLNPVIEVRPLRAQLESWLGARGEHALLLMRFGYGRPAPFSLRRPLAAVVVRPDGGHPAT
ncbi:MAG: nitroreductase [Vicinamibacteria bacterium]|jgi:hypothetical protein|nr:nitroreductase [Vicinamibacteria bacterium]